MPVSSRAPNVLLVVMDTARADGFEPYGAPTGDTPAVSQLAGMGGAYLNVFSTANWTVPSHASMLSGLQPGAVGLGQVPGGQPQCRPVLEALKPRLITEVLRAAGYRTSGISTNMWVTDQSGFDKGFDRFVTIRPTRDVHPSGSRLHHRISWDLDGVQARHDDGAAEAERTLAAFAEERTHEPFFWFVNLTECHSPYLPPRPYNDLRLLGRLRAAEDAQRYLTLTEIWKVCLGSSKIPDTAI